MGRAEDIFGKLVLDGENAIDDFIINRQTEELFLDFKRANPGGKGYGTALHKDDRKNLAKAISGFGNSEGGVIVWGVDCSRDIEIGDVAKAKVRVKNVKRFLSWIENAVSGCTVPPHKQVVNRIIGEDNNGDGFVATLVPKSNFAPHLNAINHTYYIRSGSSTMPTPHSVLAGMFGQRPQANVSLNFADQQFEVVNNIDSTRASGKNIEQLPPKYAVIRFDLLAQNDSNFLAREVFFTCNTLKKGGELCRVRFVNFGVMEAMQGVRNHLSLVAREGFRLPPLGRIRLASAEIILTPPIDSDFLFEGVVGADRTPPKTFRLKMSQADLSALVKDAFTHAGTDSFDAKQQDYFISKFFSNLKISS